MNTLTVETVLQGCLPQEYQDKVFWYADKVIKKDNIIDIYIDNEKGVTAFDTYAVELKVTPIGELVSLASSGSWEAGEIPVLVSSGSFLWINEKLVVTQRTADTKFDPLAWTTPAGRCDDTPFRTGLKETIEEIHIRSQQTEQLFIPKIAQSVVPDNFQAHYYSVNISFPEYSLSQLTRVRTWLNKELLEDTQLWFMYSKSSNTLEFRVPIISSIDEKVYYTNPEFHTDVKTLSFSELKLMKLVPAVSHLLSET